MVNQKQKQNQKQNQSPTKNAKPILKSRSSTTTNAMVDKLSGVALRIRADGDGGSPDKAGRRASLVPKGNTEFSKYVKKATCVTENLMVPQAGENRGEDGESTGWDGGKRNNNSFKKVEFDKV